MDFLEVIDKAKIDAERKQQLEEKHEMQDFRQQVANLQEKNLDKVSSTADQPIGLMIDLIHLSCSFTENSIRSFPTKGRQSQHQQSPIAKINFVRCHQKTKTKRNQRKRSIREQTIGREYR